MPSIKPLPIEIQSKLSYILPAVQKPGRYTGGELNQVIKDWDMIPTHVAFVFPDIYDLGMSNLGLVILYDLINKRSDALAERVFAPWIDMEEVMRKEGIPLYSLETKHPLSDFDIIGFSLPYETLYTNTLNLLDLGDIPLFSNDRTSGDPLVIAGGHATFNPEPMHKFIDAFVIGEGEEVINEIIDTYRDWKEKSTQRGDLLLSLSKIWGVYVPSLYQDYYDNNGIFSHIESFNSDIPLTISKRIVPKLPPAPTKFIVPYIDTVHNRIPIEIMRGCTRGCRFCHAGMVTRPVRERSIEEIINAIDESIRHTGMEEIGLLSLSSSDYTHIVDLVCQVNNRFGDQHLSISLPSLRIESVSVDLMESIRGSRSGGFTLAPEAATEKMRQIINKAIPNKDLLDTTREIYSRGWDTIKLYFMIGHPEETMEDVYTIATLCKDVINEGRKVIGKRTKLNVGLSTFVPKPHTPFQWVPCDTAENIQAKQSLLKRELRYPGIKLTWNSHELTMLEAWLSRGDRRISNVIYEAWKHGAKFDAWQDHHNHQVWLNAFATYGLEPAFYTHRPRDIDEAFPWDHIDSTVKKSFLVEDYLWSQDARTRMDCRNMCYACGILPAFADFRRQNPGDLWKCPEANSIRSTRQKSRISLQDGNNAD